MTVLKSHIQILTAEGSNTAITISIKICLGFPHTPSPPTFLRSNMNSSMSTQINKAIT